jgi:endonuclease/exonuclease/phosphatase family metal-dependent hydrolase
LKAKKKPSILSRILLFFNLIAVLALFTVYLGTRVNPEMFWPIAFAGLIYPLILIINLFFVILWIARLRWYFIISLATILLGWSQVGNFLQINKTKKSFPGDGKNFSILSYNVRVFDLYNYGPKWEHNFTERNNIFRFLKEKDFDIICLQEFVHDKKGDFKTLDTLKTFIRAKYAHTEYSNISRDVMYFGLATFSAYPILNKGIIEFPNKHGNMCMYSDIVMGSDTIRVYNVHFESIGLSPEDYVFMENITNAEHLTDRTYIKNGSLRILQRIKRAFVQRSEQVLIVIEHMDNCPYPVIFAGDFNDTPASWAYTQITQRLNDAFKSGRGIGQTYIGVIPGFRIDYILHGDEFTAYNFTTGKQKHSDHYPIWTWLNLNTDK